MNGCFNCKYQNTNICSHCRTIIGECWEHQVKTNADRIRSMTDEELAKYFAWLQDDEAEYPLDMYGNEEKIADELEWLKQKIVKE